jgi:lactate 2-monooxygenase
MLVQTGEPVDPGLNEGNRSVPVNGVGLTRDSFTRASRLWARAAAQASTNSPWPVSPEEWERQAALKLPKGPLGFIDGGAGSLNTVRENREAFDRWRLVPRMLSSSPTRDLSIHLFGHTLPSPILLAPVGVETIAHPDGELAVARAAESVGVPYIVATPSSFSMETLAQQMPQTPHWFQLYFINDREIVASLVRRAALSGYSALVVTVDTPMLGWRERDLGNQRYLPFREGAGLANFATDPVFRTRLGCDPADDPAGTAALFLDLFNTQANFALSWSEMQWLRDLTKLPLLIKGILDPEDAVRAFEIGFDGVIVSNHGGRQVDGSIAALDALVNVRHEVGHQRVVLMDSGIRRGSDVLKAIALGANAVLLGRPFMHGLAVGGQEGVEAVLLNLLADTDRTLALSGCRDISELDVTRLERRS